MENRSFKENLKAFEQVLDIDRNYAPAHFQIAQIYQPQNTPAYRQYARTALEKARQLDPDNLTYELAFGDLLWAQGLLDNADDHYEKILHKYPNHPEALFRIGHHALKNYLKYRDMVASEESVVLKSDHFAEEHYAKALAYFQKSLKSDLSFRPTYYQLGLAYFEKNQPQNLIRTAQKLLAQIPNDKDALLFCGLGWQTLGNEEEAHSYYTEALKHMPPDERAMMESVDLIAAKSEKRQPFHPLSDSTNIPDQETFWAKRDPLFLTDFNERRMTHYGRIAYANLRFSNPSNGIEGWQTDMGKTYIKYGRPLRHVSDRPWMSVGGRSTVYPHFETWFYEDFVLTFRNGGNGFDGWVFSPKTVFGGTSYMQPASPAPSSIATFNDTPPRYVDPYQKYSVPYQIAAFQEDDSMYVELSYALFKDRLRLTTGTIYVEDGFFLFDENWKEVEKKILKGSFNWPVSPSATDTTKHINNNHITSQRTLRILPNAYHFVVEIKDEKTGTIGTFRELRTFTREDSALTLSDLLLASNITPKKTFPEGRQDLKIVPNPIRTYHASEDVYIYLEIYNLAQSAFGQTNYKISYRLGIPQQKEIDPALFVSRDLNMPGKTFINTIAQRDSTGNVEQTAYEVKYVLPDRNQISQNIYQNNIDAFNKRMETGITAQYQGDRRSDFTYLQIDIAQIPTGVYHLIVSVQDQQTGHTVERTVLFRIIE